MEDNCRNCAWAIKSKEYCGRHDKKISLDDYCQDHETEHDAEITNLLFFAEYYNDP